MRYNLIVVILHLYFSIQDGSPSLHNRAKYLHYRVKFLFSEENLKMKYVSTAIPDALSVKGIFTVVSPILSSVKRGVGESHAFPEIFFVARGRHTVEVDGLELTVEGSQMVIYAPGSYHRSVSPSDSEAEIISFDVESTALPLIYNRVITLTEAQAEEFKSIFAIAKDCFESRAPEDTVRGMVLRQGVDDYTLQRIRLRLETLLTDLVESARLDGIPPTRKDAKWDAEYLKIIDFMRKNLARPLTLEEIAAECSMSVSKLKLLFREKHGGGPITCLIELKVEEAKRLIEEGKMNITEIASALGFSSVHYFSRQFKKTTGMSPTDFAKKQNITAPV